MDEENKILSGNLSKQSQQATAPKVKKNPKNRIKFLFKKPSVEDDSMAVSQQHLAADNNQNVSDTALNTSIEGKSQKSSQRSEKKPNTTFGFFVHLFRKKKSAKDHVSENSQGSQQRADNNNPLNFPEILIPRPSDPDDGLRTTYMNFMEFKKAKDQEKQEIKNKMVEKGMFRGSFESFDPDFDPNHLTMIPPSATGTSTEQQLDELFELLDDPSDHGHDETKKSGEEGHTSNKTEQVLADLTKPSDEFIIKKKKSEKKKRLDEDLKNFSIQADWDLNDISLQEYWALAEQKEQKEQKEQAEQKERTPLNKQLDPSNLNLFTKSPAATANTKHRVNKSADQDRSEQQNNKTKTRRHKKNNPRF